MDDYERVLLRQLKRLNLRQDEPPDLEAWQLFLGRVNTVYAEKGHSMYLLERSLEISSREMRELNEKIIQESEKKIEAYKHSAQKTEFLAVMSHEIRTPLNVVLGMSSLLQDTHLNSDQTEYVDAIHQSGEMLLYLVNDILDISKIEAGKLELDLIECSLPELLDNIQNMFRGGSTDNDAVFVANIADDLPAEVIADPSRIAQVFSNLLSNAFKFTSSGSVTMNVSVQSYQKNSETCKLCVEIIDTGIGISPDICDSLFQDFMQADSSHSRRFGGTGLGLAICKRLVELMQGDIGVDSVYGEGSRFWFEVPIALVKSNKKSSASAQYQRDISAARILLVEDSKANQMLATAMLKKVGYQVDTADDGQQALEILKLQPSPQYDLILMDIQMPGLNGYETTEAIRALSAPVSDLPIVAMTANVLDSERQKCIDVGMQGYVPKPFKLNKLIDQIERVLAGGLKRPQLKQV
ncbi:MAG: ATP-binding protein [Arenicella sp.]